MAKLTAELAQKILVAAAAKATEIDSPSSISILDSGREPVAFLRQDGALLASPEISSNKAYTSVSMKMPTGDLNELVQPGGPFFGLQTAQARPFVTFAGGVPILVDGEVVGAIGVAGGTGEQDEEVANAGAAVA
ncbi:GlcG/HbpS family heme-binding protein [Saccharopolyspora hattusasensis]|uniref:GlcG/HbpS family heme-binding protein n=1 Tax=Saccharopolyspora hattusasensis TaxID=1128679 RepID=UPI003D983461